MWTIQLPVAVRNHISDREFNKDTYREVFEAADKCFTSSKQINVAALAVAAVDLDETQAAFDPQNQPQVAAFTQKKKKKNKKGQQGSGQSKPQRKRHESSPPESCCDRHYTHGAGAWFCLEPQTCPWASKITPRK